MSELKPRLMVSKHPLADDDVPWPADYRPADERDIGLVLVWLQEQNVGEERHSWWSVSSYVIGPVKSGPYLVIPLDTEPPKETE